MVVEGQRVPPHNTAPREVMEYSCFMFFFKASNMKKSFEKNTSSDCKMYISPSTVFKYNLHGYFDFTGVFS